MASTSLPDSNPRSDIELATFITEPHSVRFRHGPPDTDQTLVRKDNPKSDARVFTPLITKRKGDESEDGIAFSMLSPFCPTKPLSLKSRPGSDFWTTREEQIQTEKGASKENASKKQKLERGGARGRARGVSEDERDEKAADDDDGGEEGEAEEKGTTGRKRKKTSSKNDQGGSSNARHRNAKRRGTYREEIEFKWRWIKNVSNYTSVEIPMEEYLEKVIGPENERTLNFFGRERNPLILMLQMLRLIISKKPKERHGYMTRWVHKFVADVVFMMWCIARQRIAAYQPDDKTQSPLLDQPQLICYYHKSDWRSNPDVLSELEKTCPEWKVSMTTNEIISFMRNNSLVDSFFLYYNRMQYLPQAKGLNFPTVEELMKDMCGPRLSGDQLCGMGFCALRFPHALQVINDHRRAESSAVEYEEMRRKWFPSHLDYLQYAPPKELTGDSKEASDYRDVVVFFYAAPFNDITDTAVDVTDWVNTLDNRARERFLTLYTQETQLPGPCNKDLWILDIPESSELLAHIAWQLYVQVLSRSESKALWPIFRRLLTDSPRDFDQGAVWRYSRVHQNTLRFRYMRLLTRTGLYHPPPVPVARTLLFRADDATGRREGSNWSRLPLLLPGESDAVNWLPSDIAYFTHKKNHNSALHNKATLPIIFYLGDDLSVATIKAQLDAKKHHYSRFVRFQLCVCTEDTARIISQQRHAGWEVLIPHRIDTTDGRLKLMVVFSNNQQTPIKMTQRNLLFALVKSHIDMAIGSYANLDRLNLYSEYLRAANLFVGEADLAVYLFSLSGYTDNFFGRRDFVERLKRDRRTWIKRVYPVTYARLEATQLLIDTQQSTGKDGGGGGGQDLPRETTLLSIVQEIHHEAVLTETPRLPGDVLVSIYSLERINEVIQKTIQVVGLGEAEKGGVVDASISSLSALTQARCFGGVFETAHADAAGRNYRLMTTVEKKEEEPEVDPLLLNAYDASTAVMHIIFCNYVEPLLLWLFFHHPAVVVPCADGKPWHDPQRRMVNPTQGDPMSEVRDVYERHCRSEPQRVIEALEAFNEYTVGNDAANLDYLRGLSRVLRQDERMNRREEATVSLDLQRRVNWLLDNQERGDADKDRRLKARVLAQLTCTDLDVSHIAELYKDVFCSIDTERTTADFSTKRAATSRLADILRHALDHSRADFLMVSGNLQQLKTALEDAKSYAQLEQRYGKRNAGLAKDVLAQVYISTRYRQDRLGEIDSARKLTEMARSNQGRPAACASSSSSSSSLSYSSSSSSPSSSSSSSSSSSRSLSVSSSCSSSPPLVA